MDYSNGKIYMLEPTCEYEEGDVYYGSTASTLVKRLSTHKSSFNTTKSKSLIDKYGRENIKIVLIKMFPCSCKAELSAEEGKYQRANKCVNKNIAGRTKKQYTQDNREHIAEHNKQYKQDNREQIVEYNKQYNQDNREHRKEYNKQYNQDNREKINARERARYAEKKALINK